MLIDRTSSLVIDDLCNRAVDQQFVVACFYCDYQSQKMQMPENVVGALVKQIICALGAIPTEIERAFQKSRRQVGGRGLRVNEVLELLKACLVPLERAFICIDALDELLVNEVPILLGSLHDVSRSCPGVRFLFTGRSHIEAEFRIYFPGAAQFLEIKPTRRDIMKYVKKKLNDHPNRGAMNAGLRAEIINWVEETISDAYAVAIFPSGDSSR